MRGARGACRGRSCARQPALGRHGQDAARGGVAAHLRDRGLAVCILSRGYGEPRPRRAGGQHGERAAARTASAGDEPVLLAGELPGVAVGRAGPRRGRRACPPAARPAARPLPPRRRLLAPRARPRPRPPGLPGGRSVRGRPAFPVAAACASRCRGARAPTPSCSPAPTGAAEARRAGARRRRSRPYGFTGPGFASATRPGPAAADAAAAVMPAGARVFLVSAVARPDAFTRERRAASGYEVAGELRFPDHHAYPDGQPGAHRAGFERQRRRAHPDHLQGPGQAPRPARPAPRRAPGPRRAGARLLGVARREGGRDAGERRGERVKNAPAPPPHRARRSTWR